MNTLWSWRTGLNFRSAILNLLQSFSSELDFVVGRLLGFLDEGVQYEYALSNKEAVERPTNTRPAARP